LNYGDENFVYLEEDADDNLTIFADTRTAIMGGNVGVGTLTPANKFSVSGNTDFSGFLSVGASNAPPGGALLQFVSPLAKTNTSFQSVAFLLSNEPLESNPFGLRIGMTGGATLAERNVSLQTTDVNSAGGGNILMQQDGGNVGIGAVFFPPNKLDVGGNASIQGNLGIGTFTPANKLSVVGNADFGGNVGIGTPSPQNQLTVVGNADFGGNVGIGIPSPANKLSVMGNADISGNLGIGTTTAPAKLTVKGSKSDPSIPGTTSTGVFRVGVASDEGIDFGKMASSPYAAWIQTGYDGTSADPLSLQPSGGNVGIGITNPLNKLSVSGNADISGILGIGTAAPEASAQVDVTSTTKGFLPPRMTGAQRNAIVSPAAGLIIYCTDCRSGGEVQFFNGIDWRNMSSGPAKNPFAGMQSGADIDGEAAGDNCGISVSLSADASRIAIGATGNDGTGTDAGHVRIYEWTGAAWVQLGTDINGEAAGDLSGVAVSLSSSGSRVAIGAFHNAGTGTDAGHVRIYQWDGVAWVQLGADINGEAANDASGVSVSLSSDGTRVAIGATGNDGNGPNAGHVRIYQWNGTAWVQLGADIDGEFDGLSLGDQSGSSVSLSSDGTRLAIGAPFNDGNGSDAGHVRIYQWNGTAWVQQGADIDSEAAGDQSGSSVSLSSDGNCVAIGAPANDGSGASAGHVRIYQWNGTTWVQQGADIDGEAAGDQSGRSVSLSSDGARVAIGAYLNDGSGGDAGHVRIYQWNGAAWVQQGADIDGEAAGDWSGFAVSMSSDATRVAVGAWFNDGNGASAGHVRVYK
jgi:hypothetical protein